jgi:hypothetical protein
MAIQNDEIATNPLKISLIREYDGHFLIITYLTLSKNSILLKYSQYKFTVKSGTLSTNIGVNPKEYIQMQRTHKPESYYSWHHRLYFIVINRIYIIELDAATDRSIAIPLKDNYHFDKIVTYDTDNRLLLVLII